MKNLLVSLSCAALLVGVSARSASADMFTFSIPGSTAAYGGSGTLTTSTGTGGVFTITGINGTIGGMTITGLIAPGGYPVATTQYPGFIAPNDNKLYYPASSSQNIPGAGASFLDVQGFSFTAGTSNTPYNIYFGQDFSNSQNITVIPNDYQIEFGPSGINDVVLGGFVVSPATTGGGGTPVVPEPASLVLLGTGALGLAGAARRRLQA